MVVDVIVLDGSVRVDEVGLGWHIAAIEPHRGEILAATAVQKDNGLNGVAKLL